MNIFYLDKNPSIAAKYHCDKHVVKMILESVQMLKLAHGQGKGYRNHPCSIWVRESIQNYRWLASLALSLCREYNYRYCKNHKYESIIRYLIYNEPELPNVRSTKPALAMPDEYKNETRFGTNGAAAGLGGDDSMLRGRRRGGYHPAARSCGAG